MIKFTIDFDNNLFVTANNRHICVLAEECDTATLGESYDSAEREFFPILAEFAFGYATPPSAILRRQLYPASCS